MTALPRSLDAMIGKALRAIEQDDANTIAEMLEAGMHPELKLKQGVVSKRGITLSVGKENPEIFDLYVRHGANVNLSVISTNNPLFVSVTRNDVRGAVRCLAAGGDVTKAHGVGTKNHDGLLHVAAQNGNVDMLRLLLDAGGWAVMERDNERGNTPAQEARAHMKQQHSTANTPPRQAFKDIIALIDEYRALPRLPIDSGEFGKDDLFRVDAQGRSPLEHPETWQRWGEICAVLEKRGELPTKQDLLAPLEKGGNGLTRAARCFALEPVVEQLLAQGEPLTQDDLLTRNRTPNGLLEAIIENRQIGCMMNLSHCRGWTANGIRDVVNHLPEADRKAFVPNYHQLRHAIQQAEAQRDTPVRSR